jgi:sensor c-di-GMP phosphodiesterase-like protein
VDIIKIDRAFVRRIGEGQAGERLLASVIEMASALNLQIVAEGIETKEQAAWLTARGIMWQQGYLYSPPVDFQHLVPLIRN